MSTNEPVSVGRVGGSGREDLVLEPVGGRTSSYGDVLLSVRDLRTYFHTDDGTVKAVDGISFDVHRGEVFSIVGESGSGKSVSAMTIMDLLPTASVESGEILWHGEDLLKMSEERRRKIRGGEIAMIFQDPLTALNPVHNVGKQIGEMARIHEGLSRRNAMKRAIEMLELVGIPEPAKRAKMHPHEFSGGMRQRAMIAMAICSNPDLLIADEPTTALDVTVQAQVLQVLLEIKDEIDSAIILITHDLGVVAGVADNVMVMYAGRQAEMGVAEDIFYDTRHPYTLGLLASLPRVDADGEEALVPIGGAPPSLINRPSGCPFHPRCQFSKPEPCETVVPDLLPVNGSNHTSACHFAADLANVSVDTLRAERGGEVPIEAELEGAAEAERNVDSSGSAVAVGSGAGGVAAASVGPTRSTSDGHGDEKRPPT